jgi:transposase-like protein
MRRRSRDEWRTVCAASYASGLTIREFADRAGVNPRTLSWWCSELRDECATAGFVEVGAAREEPAEDDAVVIEIGGARVTLRCLPPAAWLAELAASC